MRMLLSVGLAGIGDSRHPSLSPLPVAAQKVRMKMPIRSSEALNYSVKFIIRERQLDGALVTYTPVVEPNFAINGSNFGVASALLIYEVLLDVSLPHWLPPSERSSFILSSTAVPRIPCRFEPLG